MTETKRRVRGATRAFIVYSRLSDQERSWLEHMAQTERRTMSDMIRQAVFEAAERRGLTQEAAA